MEQSEKHEGEMLDIWFFVSLILIAYGIVLTLAGIYYIFKPYTGNEFGYLNLNLWWGPVMLIFGVLFQFISFKGRSKKN